MAVVLAALPLTFVLIAMVVLRWSAMFAGAAGLALALMLSVGLIGPFDIGNAAPVDRMASGLGALAEAVHSAVTILWIILPALVIYEYLQRTGGAERIRGALAGLTEDRRLQAILIAWFFGLFIEGTAGFGTPVALGAPLLVGLGYAPVRAVALALLGHAAGVSFAAVGTPTLAQLELSDLDPRELSGRIAFLHAALGWILLLFMVRLAGEGPLRGRDLAWAALAAVCFFGPVVVLAVFTGPELPSLGGALIGGFVFVMILRRNGPSKPLSARSLLPDLAPYLMIVALILITRLIGPVEDALRAPTLSWNMHDTFSGSFQPLYHPGTLMWLGLILGALLTGRFAMIGPSAAAALRRVVPVSLALLMMLGLSRVLVHSGMIAALAEAAAQTGGLWPVLAPAVGVLGTFITGSATASNILFTELQLAAAASLSLPPTTMAAAQALGAAIGNVIAPHNIIAGAATVGLIGREGEVLSRTLGAGVLYTVLGGLAVLGLTLIA